MFKIGIGIAISIMLILTGLLCSAQPTVRAGRERAMDSLVQVIVETRFNTERRCSGYMFSTNGYVVTAFHVVSDARSIHIFHPDYGVFEVDSVRRLDKQADIAVLGLDTVDRPDFGGAKLGDHRGLKTGDTVHILHHPAYGELSEYTTTISDVGFAQQYEKTEFLSAYANDRALIQVEGPFDCGSAGGIVCSDTYEVVGILIGGDAPATPQCKVYALASIYLAPMLIKTYKGGLDELQTQVQSDAELFDKYLGPAARHVDFGASMPEGYIAWFAPLRHVEYSDFEFTNEINDKVDKNWFYSAGMVIDGRPLREWSAARIFILPATTNVWDWKDHENRYIHFDADSLFKKRIYKNREMEERIMTRHILAMPLAKGAHALQYENKGANYKSTGIKRTRINLAAAEIKLVDIQGLSLVSMVLLPNSALKAGEGEPVRYELERRPYQDKELNWSVRTARVALQP